MTSAHSSNRPVAVSSMSSLDSLIDAALDNKTNTLSVEDDCQIPTANRNVVSSSTLSSIGASPQLKSTDVPGSGALPTNATTISSSSAPTGMMLSAPVAIAPSSATAPTPASAAPNNNTVAEFLFQLSKMLTDDNKEIIEWNNGQINVHDPYKLQSEVLHNYFRHSKFASFQRQLNYFGFRKLAGKGKMAPCSYVNEATTADIRSLLLIKRKAGPSTVKEKGTVTTKKRSRSGTASESGTTESTAPVNPVLAGILHQNYGASLKEDAKVPAKSKGTQAKVTSSSSQQELARAAVGKGVRHGFMPFVATSAGSATEALASASMIFPDLPQFGPTDIQDSLSELTNNYRNSLQAADESQANQTAKSAEEGQDQSNQSDSSFQMYNFLSRDSSLVDLAMLVPFTNGAEAASEQDSSEVEPTPVNEMRTTAMPFIDFPGLETPNEKDMSG